MNENPRIVEITFLGKPMQINLDAKADLGYLKEYYLTADIVDPDVISAIVYNDDDPMGQEYVVRNPNLTAAHCDYLVDILLRDSGYILTVVNHPNISQETLLRLANTEKSDYVLKAITNCVKAEPHIKALAALRIGSFPNHY